MKKTWRLPVDEKRCRGQQRLRMTDVVRRERESVVDIEEDAMDRSSWWRRPERPFSIGNSRSDDDIQDDSFLHSCVLQSPR